MTVLITGGAGYIGSHMIWRLLDAGHKVVVLDNLRTGFRQAIAPDAIFVEGNIEDRQLVCTTVEQYGIDCVVHFAGSVVVPQSVSDPLGYYHNNTVASHRLIETCLEAGVTKFIFSSSAAVYGTPQHIPVAETAPTHPESPYGTSKLMTEWMLRDAAAAGKLAYCALRYFNVAGADPLGRTGQRTKGATHLIKVACEVAAGTREKIQIYGTDYDTPDGTCIRDYIHVADLVDIHALALDRLCSGAPSLVVNCGYGRGYSVRQVLDTVRRVSGHPLKVEDGPRRPGDAACVVADATRVHREFAWKAHFDDLETIVASTLAWERRKSRS